MKPKHLKIPFTWEERRPLIADRVLYVPKYYQSHETFGKISWEDAGFFGNSNDVFVEYCAGNGAWIAEKAVKHPDSNWVAVERRFDRARKIWSKVKNFGLSNLIVVCGEAESFTSYYLKDSSISGIFVNFPDPWPKEKHAKNRLLKEPFLTEMSRVLKCEGRAVFVTDDEDYSLQMVAEMKKNPLWHADFEDPYYITDWPYYGSSYFDELWREKGKTIRYIQFTNNKKDLCKIP